MFNTSIPTIKHALLWTPSFGNVKLLSQDKFVDPLAKPSLLGEQPSLLHASGMINNNNGDSILYNGESYFLIRPSFLIWSVKIKFYGFNFFFSFRYEIFSE